MTCQTIGRPPISTSGLGIDWVCSCSRVPRASAQDRDGRLGGAVHAADYPIRGTAGSIRARWPPSPTQRSSRPTTSAGSTASDIDADAAEQIGRAFVRVIAELEGKPASDLRLGLGHDMRLTAPEMAAAYREGMCSEGAHVLDAGRGRHRDALLPRRLPGPRRRPDVHRLAQPEALHRRQARQARGDRPVGRRRDRRRRAPGSRTAWAIPRAAAASRRSRSATSSTRPR